ncbi:MAG: flippase-like domain-containing protein [Crocinitomicaceae bacterium]|nr:flippase-like domain-containing protein [Crocinitomicaceae bacterium]MBK8926873.1 flippase-like domain-containing protein [Crocinitomicaceae bacterium]
MKNKLFAILKLLIPLAFGLFLIWLFYDALCEKEKIQLFNAFGQADYMWVGISLIFGFASHISRAYRWKYMLTPMGYQVNFWNSYHAVMISNFVNLAFPRAGEISRAAVISKTEKIPFQKGFGSILAERAVDVGMLGLVTIIGIAFQFDKFDLFQHKLDVLKEGAVGSCGNLFLFNLFAKVVMYGIILAIVAVIGVYIFRKKFRERIRHFVKGIIEGVIAIFKMKKKMKFIFHTFFIWAMYICMFSICFFSLDSTANLGLDAMLPGFVAGTVGIILVQGGIGIYPAAVGMIITIYMDPTGTMNMHPEALALGWIIWTSQTAMMVILGLISMALNGKNVTFDADESLVSASEKDSITE